MKEKLYVIAIADGSEFYIPNAQHIERNDEVTTISDDEAARLAEQDGIALIYGMDGVPDGIYVDTVENREAIQKALIEYPNYYIAK